MKNSAFTLAEVLVTLGIIGIVAAMTIPSLVNRTRNKQLETGLKRSYSVLSQALDLYYAKNGERIKKGELSRRQLKPLLMPYLASVKDCGNGAEQADQDIAKVCVPNYVYQPDLQDKKLPVYKTFNGAADIYLGQFDDGQFVLNDSTLVLIENQNDPNLFISIDVNGYQRRPNRLGQDLFMFEIDEKGRFLPMGVKGTQHYSENDELCSASSRNALNGAGCTYKALYEKDYFKNLPK